MEKDYYLGLDIGTDSVGWAVCNPYYQILKFKGNSMWGIRLFDESSSAEKRREFRSARRRNQRKRERIALLEMLFDNEICKVDPAFFIKLHESNLYFDDNESEYRSYLGEWFELLCRLKAVYDWAILADILNGKEYISFSKVDIYEKHGRDLKTLK